MFTKLLHQSVKKDEKIPHQLPYLAEVATVRLSRLNVAYVNRSISGCYNFKFHGYAIIIGKPKIIITQIKNCPSKHHSLLKTHVKSIYLGSSSLYSPVTDEKINIIYPYLSYDAFCIKDADAVKSENAIIKYYPSINPLRLLELINYQHNYYNYLIEKINVPKENNKKSSELISNTKRILTRFVKFHVLPGQDLFYANCNKATATLLQEAQDQSSNIQQPSVNGASQMAVGASERMFFWNSQLHQSMINFFINRELKTNKNGKIIDKIIEVKMDELNRQPLLLNELVNNKDNILKIISTWPKRQQIMALQQILDVNMPLGKIFYSQRSWTIRAPNISRGYLKKAALLLQEIKVSSQSKQPS